MGVSGAAHLNWREILAEEDEAALTRYSRSRDQFSGTSPTLIVIDATESFFGPNAPVLEAQETGRQACGEKAWAALPWITKLIERFRHLGLPVVFTAPDSNQSWMGGATRGTVEFSTTPSLMVQPEASEIVIFKAKASAFFGTALVSGLVSRNSDSVVLVGGTTSGCVRATAVDASSYGFDVLVAEEGCFDRTGLGHAVALREIDAKYGRVLRTDEVASFLGRTR